MKNISPFVRPVLLVQSESLPQTLQIWFFGCVQGYLYFKGLLFQILVAIYIEESSVDCNRVEQKGLEKEMDELDKQQLPCTNLCCETAVIC